MTILWSILSWTTHYNIDSNNIISLFVQYGTPSLPMDAVPATIVDNVQAQIKTTASKILKSWLLFQFIRFSDASWAAASEKFFQRPLMRSIAWVH